MFEPTYFALVDNDVVVGVYVADAEWVSNQAGTWLESTKENLAWIGATVTDGIFEKHIDAVERHIVSGE